MILGIPAQHHEETCRRARQVYSRYGTAQEASVDKYAKITDCTSRWHMHDMSGHNLSIIDSMCYWQKVISVQLYQLCNACLYCWLSNLGGRNYIDKLSTLNMAFF